MLFLDLFKHDQHLIELQAGTELFHEGESGDVMYVLLTGEANVQVAHYPVTRVRAGEILGEMSAVDGSPRSATVTALTNCRLAVVDQQRFLFLVNESPYFALEVIKVMAQRLRESNLELVQTSEELVALRQHQQAH